MFDAVTPQKRARAAASQSTVSGTMVFIGTSIAAFFVTYYLPSLPSLDHLPIKPSAYFYLFAISGLILFFPANLFPILTLDFKGRLQDSSVITGVAEMYEFGMGGVATLVLFCAIIIPFMKLLVITFVLSCVRFGFKPRGLISLFRFYLAINVWGMLEIFLLAILLSCLKLADDADILFRGGFYAFIGLMMCALLISATLDEGHLWHRLDRSLYG
jgi:paraquat-inducible protein A